MDQTVTRINFVVHLRKKHYNTIHLALDVSKTGRNKTSIHFQSGTLQQL